MPLSAGARLGPYEIVAPLGAGGMGEVYRARDTRLDRIVAVKVLPSDLAADPEFRERFEREARLISSLSHPNVCPLFDVGNQDGVEYLVMEYLDGETLAARIEKGPVPLDQALAIAIESRNEIYVQGFPKAASRTQISTAGGLFSRWRRDGTELFFTSTAGEMMAVSIGVTADGGLKAGRPTKLFAVNAAVNAATGWWDVTPDGQRFLISTSGNQATGAVRPITVVVNWNRRDAPAKRQ